MKNYDVIVIGAGHAGTEAAAAAARRGANTLLITKSPDDLGALSCNPSIGGPGKSQLVAEMDALGGIMPRAADRAAIHFRNLNAAHGPATQALRAQVDRKLYSNAIKELLNDKTLDIVCQDVTDLDLENKIVNGQYQATALVITTGTFLCGLVTQGCEKISSGRLQDDGSYQDSTLSISPVLSAAGFKLMRLKTGTPARLYRDSIDFSKLEIQAGDENHAWFSSNTSNLKPATSNLCHITHTTPAMHDFIRENIKDAPMYNGDITGTGPRYCPSIEDKVMRFPEHTSHHVFLEPEGLDSDLIYPAGLSSSFSAELQDKWLRMVPGLENVRVARYGYAIEYDAIDARALKSNLESKDWPGLFFAGQINGTSGYEEAAAQGLVAGANAAAFALRASDIGLNRTNSMIGVMIDDITTLGVDEPYRMFTSRAEYRLSLRSDNVIFRLGDIAVECGLLSVDDCEKIKNQKSEIRNKIDKIYAGYIERQTREIDSVRRDMNLKIPVDFDYSALSGLTNELLEKMTRTRPENIAALSRIPGMTPAGVLAVLCRIRKV